MERGQILGLIGGNIRDARLRSNLTQEALAEMIDIHWKTIGYIESGKRDFGVSLFAKIVLVLNLRLDEALEGVSIDPKVVAVITKATKRKKSAKRK